MAKVRNQVPRPRGKTDSGDSLISKLKEQIRQLKSTVRRLQKQISKLRDEILVTESTEEDYWDIVEEQAPKSSDLCRKCKAPSPSKLVFKDFTVTSCLSCGDRYRKPRTKETSDE